MASTLYKTIDGELHTTIVETKYVAQHFSDGWSGSKEPKIEEPAEFHADEFSGTSDNEMTNEEIREAAKAAGIEGWDTKRFATLIEELAEE